MLQQHRKYKWFIGSTKYHKDDQSQLRISDILSRYAYPRNLIIIFLLLHGIWHIGLQQPFPTNMNTDGNGESKCLWEPYHQQYVLLDGACFK